MTPLAIIFAIVIILIIGYLTHLWMPATPPFNIIKWIIFGLLIVVMFVILFQILGWVNFGALNHPV